MPPTHWWSLGIRAVLVGLLGWQAADAVGDAWTAARSGTRADLGTLWAAAPAERLAATVGPRHQRLAVALPDALPADAVLLTRVSQNPVDAIGVVILRAVLYPVWVCEVDDTLLAAGLVGDLQRPVYFLDWNAGVEPPGDRWVEPEPVAGATLFRLQQS